MILITFIATIKLYRSIWPFISFSTFRQSFLFKIFITPHIATSYITHKIENQIYLKMKEWIKVFVRLLVVVIGLLGNLSSFTFFMRKKKKLNFYVLMIMLSVYNVLMILMDLLIFTVPLVTYYHYIIMAAYSLLEVGVTGSIYSTIAISTERYLVVCHPFYADSHKKWSTRRQILLVTMFSFIYGKNGQSLLTA